MSEKEILEQEQEVQEETEVQVSEEQSTDKTNTKPVGSTAKRSLDKDGGKDPMPTIEADQS